MKKDQLAFLIAGVLFGVLLGYGLFHALGNRPSVQAAAAGGAQGIPSPAGPMAPGPGMPAGTGGMPAAGTAGMAGGPQVAQQIEQLEKALEIAPDNLNALTRLANLYHDEGMWEKAVAAYDRALAITPNDPNLLTDQGICYRGLRRFEEALAKFRQARTVAPTHWQSLFNTAVVAGADLGRYDEALAALAQVEKEAPPEAHPQIHDLQHAYERAKSGTKPAGTAP